MTGRTYMPFAELLVGNHFVLHSKHLPPSVERSPVFVKTGENTFKNTKPSDNPTDNEHGMCPAHKTRVLCSLCEEA